MKSLSLVFAGALVAAGCASAPADPSPVVSPIQITSVEVLLLESLPVQGLAHVTGVIGDGCSTLLSETVDREGNEITVTILRERPADAICTQIALLYDERIPLGELAPGDYVLRVNDVVEPFRVD